MACDERPIRGLLPELVAAANHRGSHARLLAGPGTGNTRTLVELVESLINDATATADEILCLTFTGHPSSGDPTDKGVRVEDRPASPPSTPQGY